jgi:hypothetical protein
MHNHRRRRSRNRQSVVALRVAGFDGYGLFDFLTNKLTTSSPPKHARFGGGGRVEAEFLKKAAQPPDAASELAMIH